jgi:phage recombination protein Bet
MNGNTAMTVGGAMMTPAVPQRGFTAEQRKLILDTCCGGASQTDAAVLVAIAEARGLNPILGDCFFVNRGGKWAVQASIDSFRAKAEETGDYAGQDEPEYETDEKGNVVCAKVRVYRKSVQGRAFATGVAYMAEFRANSPFWTRMPRNQLAKCAEAAALRKAFPKVLAKVYTPEEMAQADKVEPEVQEEQKPKGVNTVSFRRWAAEIRACADGKSMSEVAHRIKAAVDEGKLTMEQREKLKKVYAEHLEKLTSKPELEVDGDDANEAEAEAMASANDE